MTSRRLRRIIRSRWWVLAMAGFFSVAAAVLIIQSRNNAIPEYEAVAAVVYSRLAGEVDNSGAQERLSTARQIAVTVNASDLSTGRDPLSAGERAEVVAVVSDLTLFFIGRGDSAEATVLATTLLDRYLAAQRLDVSEELATRIEDTAARLDVIVAAIATATEPPALAEVEMAARIRELQAEVNTLAALYGDLTAETLNPRSPPRSTEAIIADRQQVSSDLRIAQDELLSVQFEVGTAPPERVELSLLRAEEAQIAIALDELIAESIADEPIAVVGPVDVHPAGIEPIPLFVGIVIGLSVGLLIGIVGLVIVDRVRRPLWEITELEPRFRLSEMPERPRSRGQHGTAPWYDTASKGPRKARIQELRSVVEGVQGFGGGLVIGVASLNGWSSHAHELAADLAAGLRSTGSLALLIDADYNQPSDLAEYRGDKFELEEVIADPQETIVKALNRADRDGDFLGVSITTPSADAADVLAQPAFARMLDAAQPMYDVVIVACPPTDTPSYHVLSQRLDAMMLVATAGDPQPADVLNALRTLEARRSFPAGVVLTLPRIGPVSLLMSQLGGPPPTVEPAWTQPPEWHWSQAQDAIATSDNVVTGEFPGASTREPVWPSRKAAPWGDRTPDAATEPSQEQDEADHASVENRKAGASPWSHRDQEG